MRARAPVAALLALLGACAWAQEPDDAAALSLPGSAPAAAESPRAWRLFVEAAAGRAVVRDAALVEDARATERLSLDLQVDLALSPTLRGILADRLDVDWEKGFAGRNPVNTLKEAYVSWQPRNDVIVDFGRINQYSGVALGYNPTDFFRTSALRSVTSLDPSSIKKNRQGSVMLRGQTLWNSGSLTALYSPKLGDDPSDAPFSPNWGATNPRGRALLMLSTRLSADLNPQWLLYKEEGASAQAGMNLTRLLNDSTVAYLEWSGGRGAALLPLALGQSGEEAFRNRVSTGLTYTTSNKLSLTLEYEYNGAGLDKAAWRALPQLSPLAYLAYRQRVQRDQEMPTRHEAFFYATWQDMLMPHLDMTAMLRSNRDDGSRLAWAEVRYRWTRDEIALQWQGNRGSLPSEYGAAPTRKSWQALYLHFF